MRDREERDASQDRYYNSAYPNLYTVQSALDHLLYSPLTASISNSVNEVEEGSTVTSLSLSYTLSKNATSASISGVGPVETDAGTYVVALNGVSLTSNTTYTLTVTDGRTNLSPSTSVLFKWRKYWGKSSAAALDTAEVLALEQHQLDTDRSGNITVSDLNNEYLYLAYPSSFGDATFRVNGLIVTFNKSTIASFTNAVGGSTEYSVYRSINLLNGSVTATVS